MKKVLALVVGLVLVIGVAFAASVDFDFSKLSNDELYEMYAKLNQEFSNRGITKKALVEGGVYYGGKDIPEGYYLIVTDNAGREKAAALQIENVRGKNGLKYEMVGAAPGGKAQIYITIDEGDKISSPAPIEFIMNPPAITFE